VIYDRQKFTYQVTDEWPALPIINTIDNYFVYHSIVILMLSAVMLGFLVYQKVKFVMKFCGGKRRVMYDGLVKIITRRRNKL
jgi:hypothetical protein